MFIVANWKMTPLRVEEAISRIKSLKIKRALGGKVQVIVCPPAVYLSEVIKVASKKKILIGSQDISAYTEDANTGEFSAIAIKHLGAKYCIVGHSERRNLGESDDLIAIKMKNAILAGLTPILCVGEKERDADGLYFGLLKKQIVSSLSVLKPSQVKKIIIAYEPLYAIGAKDALPAEEIYHSSLFIKKVIADRYGQSIGKNLPILYGGSVDVKNFKDILQNGRIDGLLIGRTSWNPKTFSEIINNA